MAETPSIERVVLIVCDSVGCGALPDASAYGDEGADTLGNLSVKLGGLTLPHLQALGLGLDHRRGRPDGGPEGLLTAPSV